MDYLLEGLNQGNLVITSAVMLVLVVASTKARFLDSAGVAAAVFVGLIVGLLGHWTWLLILLAFLVFSHFATKWKFEEKKARNMSESDDGHRGWVNHASSSFDWGVRSVAESRRCCSVLARFHSASISARVD